MYGNLELLEDLEILKSKKHLEISSIGKTVLGNDIHLIKAGNGRKKVLIISGHHSLETITSKFTVDYLKNTKEGMFKDVCLYAIPILNVDGTEFHLKRIDNKNFEGQEDIWQANHRGIDLNHNYNAGFYIAKGSVFKKGINSPNSTKYGGLFPFSEPETRVVRRLCQKVSFSLAIAFHTQGEEIYFGYNGAYPDKTFTYLNAFEEASGYIASYPTGTASHAGFKDWFIKKYKKPAFTIEAGLGKNPLDFSQYDDLYQKCSRILDMVL